MAPFRGEGRRLHDGAPMQAERPSKLLTVIAPILVALAVGLCPSHDDFEKYLAAAAAHPSGYLGNVMALADRLRISVTSESKAYLLFRTGSHRSRTFIGILGTWVALPRLPSAGGGLSLPSFPRDWNLASSVCTSGASGRPDEMFALLCVCGFLLLQWSPRFAMRHGFCSLSSLSEGRLWTIVTSNFIHGNPAHLLHNVINVLHLGPVIHSALGCERAAKLLGASMLASSAASVLWHGMYHARRGGGSVGASGVTMALVAANAALFPHVVVRMYGFELTAGQLPLMYLLLDVISAGGRRGAAAADSIDISAHLGGALAGWALGTRWKPWYL